MFLVVRLAGGVVVGRGSRVWSLGPGGTRLDAEDGAPPGTAVAVGPADADDAGVDRALAELRALVAAGGVVAAGAGVDLGAGFTSGRLDGARGDRRDAVLAALRVLGVGNAHRLGERAATLVALFGPAATKRVGAAATEAIGQGRWSAVHLASAASDVLGPEQLERVLALTSASTVDPCPHGSPSSLGADLRTVLEPMLAPRRLALIVDLWQAVCAERERAVRRDRLHATQARQSRVDDLRQRYVSYEEELLLDQLRRDLGHQPTVAEAARWIPRRWYWRNRLGRVVSDAVSATVLARAVVSVSELGPAEGLDRHRAELRAAVAMQGTPDSRASRRVRGLTGLPARPGRHLHDLHEQLEAGPIDDRAAAFVRQRLARARDYGTVVLAAAEDLVRSVIWLEPSPNGLDWWLDGDLRDWRTAAGYVRSPAGWEQPRIEAPSLAERLAAEPTSRPEDLETVGDLLWYADLADALARLNGHDAAAVTHAAEVPGVNVDPPPPPREPLVPSTDSIPLAVAGAAQLVSLGAEAPPRVRTWAGLVDELMAATTVVEALTGGTFRIPTALSNMDGQILPGTRLRIELARTPHQLAEWSAYMGNCIAGQYYLDAAAKGGCVLVALRDEDDRIVVNIELVPARGGRSWRVDELRARFNADPESELERRIADWVESIRAPARTAPPPAHPARTRAPRARGGRSRLVPDVGVALDELTDAALAAEPAMRAAAVFAAVARRLSTADDPLAALTALRRASSARLTDAVRATLAAEGRLDDLWAATGVRPLATALAALDPHLRERYERLDLLPLDTPLPGSLRRLARRPGVASARSMDLAGQRIRGVIGSLARADDPVLAAAVREHPATDVLCALVLAVASSTPSIPLTPVAEPGVVSVPGYPASGLADSDGPWRRAEPDAVELGADDVWERIAHDGLRVPTAWLGAGGWTALWHRAAR